MDKQSMTLFIVVYSIAGLLLLLQAVLGIRKGQSMKQIGKGLLGPLGIIIGTLIIWYSMAETGNMLSDIFKF